MNEQQPHWHPNSMLPTFTEIVDGMLESSMEQLTNMQLAAEKPHVMNDAIINRIINLYSEQLKDHPYFEEQFVRWKKESLSDADSIEVDRLIKQLVKVKEINENILTITHSIEHTTIDKILGMSDDELALAVLSGRIKSPRYNNN